MSATITGMMRQIVTLGEETEGQNQPVRAKAKYDTGSIRRDKSIQCPWCPLRCFENNGTKA